MAPVMARTLTTIGVLSSSSLRVISISCLACAVRVEHGDRGPFAVARQVLRDLEDDRLGQFAFLNVRRGGVLVGLAPPLEPSQNSARPERRGTCRSPARRKSDRPGRPRLLAPAPRSRRLRTWSAAALTRTSPYMALERRVGDGCQRDE